MNRTKKAISDAFWQLLEENPYNKITVQSIVDHCQVNRKTFYYHFPDIPALTEYSITEWADQVIQNNCELGSPLNCIIPAAQELTKRKMAFRHLYRSSYREEFTRHLNEIGLHVVRSYVDRATKDLHISPDDKLVCVRYYKCIFVGIVLDWLDAGANYDLPDFCKKVCALFEDAGRRTLLKQEQEPPLVKIVTRVTR